MGEVRRGGKNKGREHRKIYSTKKAIKKIQWYAAFKRLVLKIYIVMKGMMGKEIFLNCQQRRWRMNLPREYNIIFKTNKCKKII